MSNKQTNACPLKKTSIGGQALMEGIMMRGPKVTAMAVRNPQGEIVLERVPTEGKKRPAICRWPIVRGVFGFVDSMSLGYKCLMRSAEISGLEEIEAEMAKEKAEKKAAKKAAKEAAQSDRKGRDARPPEQSNPEPSGMTEDFSAPENVTVPHTPVGADVPADDDGSRVVTPEPASAVKEEKKESVMMTVIMVISMIFAFGIMIGLFFFLPSFLYKDVMEAHIPGFPQNNRFLQSICGALIRLILLIGYMSLMLLMKDIRRTFKFHGAEHKTIFCYEQGLELTVENVRRQRRFHPRCGTSFLVLMLLVGILIGFLIPAGINKWLLTAIKIAIMPLVMGLGYELIKLCGRFDNWLTRIIAAPGLWFQRITVLEPDDSMIECAIAAMKEVIPEDGSDTL